MMWFNVKNNWQVITYFIIYVYIYLLFNCSVLYIAYLQPNIEFI